MPIKKRKLTPSDINRLVAWRLLLDMERTVYVRHFKDEYVISSLLDFHVLTEVFTSELEGKPLRVSKAAAYLGVPRETVRRTLARLEKRKLVRRDGQVYLYAGDKCERTIEKVARLVKNAAAQMAAQNGRV
jgi:predicted DNA-binding transcriptional regulator